MKHLRNDLEFIFIIFSLMSVFGTPQVLTPYMWLELEILIDLYAAYHFLNW
jgi:hypothetical protein